MDKYNSVPLEARYCRLRQAIAYPPMRGSWGVRRQDMAAHTSHKNRRCSSVLSSELEPAASEMCWGTLVSTRKWSGILRGLWRPRDLRPFHCCCFWTSQSIHKNLTESKLPRVRIQEIFPVSWACESVEVEQLSNKLLVIVFVLLFVISIASAPLVANRMPMCLLIYIYILGRCFLTYLKFRGQLVTQAVVRAYLITDEEGYRNLSWVWPLTRGDDLQDQWAVDL